MPKDNCNMPIWNFFKDSVDSDGIAICNYCSKELSYRTTITSLRLHLKMRHESEYDNLLLAEQLIMSVNRLEKNDTETRNQNSNLPIWNFFEKSGKGNKIAYCNYCSNKFSYKTSITNLKTHLKTHNKEYQYFLKLTELHNSVRTPKSSTSENDETETKNENEDIIEQIMSINGHEKNDTKTRNQNSNLPIWNFFKESGKGNKTAYCNYCKNNFSYKTSLTNLKSHLKTHNKEYKYFLKLTELHYSVRAPKSSTSENDETETKNENEDIIEQIMSINGHEKNDTKTRNLNLPIWNFFKKSGEGNKTAYCNYCKNKFSYKTTITNLKSHLKMKHEKGYKYFLKLTEHHNLATAPKSSTSENDETEMTFENEDIGNVYNSPTPKGSDVLWTFFGKSNDETQIASCNYCSEKLSYEPELSVLKAHLKNEHISEYNNYLTLVEPIESAPENSASGNDNKVSLENQEIDNESRTFVIETVESVPSSPSVSAQEDLSSDNEKTENCTRPEKPISSVWIYFTKLDEHKKIAVCNNCSIKMSYKTTIGNLKTHLKNKHPSDYKILSGLPNQLESTPENMKERTNNNTSVIWNFFEKSRSGNKTAVCNYCSKKLSYKTTITNLKSHLKNSHFAEYSIFCELSKEMESANTFEDSTSEVENADNVCEGRSKSATRKRHITRDGIIWNFFEESHSGDRIAVCNYCSKMISYKTTIANLKGHLRVRHKSEYTIFVELTKQLRNVEKRLENATSDIEGTENVRPSTSGDDGIWKYYERSKYGLWIAICNYCGSHLSHQSTVINLITHLKDEHPEIYREYSEFGGGSRSRKRRHSSCVSGRSDRASESDEDLPVTRLTLRKSSIDTSYNEANNSNEQDTLLIPPDAIKRRISSDIADEDATEQDQEAEKDDVWNYFEKIPSNRAQCILCKETFNRHVPFLTKHLNEKHRKVALDLPSDSDDDQNCYTEVVYLEEEQPINVPTKPKKIKQVPEPKNHRSSTRYEFVNKPKDDEIGSKTEVDDEIENFGRYVIGLLKKMPKDVSTQLQMDIISMIMTAKLKIQTPATENVNVSVSSVQIVTPSNDIVAAPSNVIVTTPSNVIHTTQNNESLPTLVIGVQKES